MFNSYRNIENNKKSFLLNKTEGAQEESKVALHPRNNAAFPNHPSTKQVVLCSYQNRQVMINDRFLAAATSGDLLVVETLLKPNISAADPGNINCKNDEKRTALILAAMGGHESVIRFLIRKGADVNWIDKFGCSAIMHAAKNLHGQALMALLAANANIAPVNKTQKSILELATVRTRNVLKKPQLSRQEAIIKILFSELVMRALAEEFMQNKSIFLKDAVFQRVCLSLEKSGEEVSCLPFYTSIEVNVKKVLIRQQETYLMLLQILPRKFPVEMVAKISDFLNNTFSNHYHAQVAYLSYQQVNWLQKRIVLPLRQISGVGIDEQGTTRKSVPGT